MGYQEVIFPAGTSFLVTGGAGFIGSNLCEALLKKGCRVRCLDNLSGGKLENTTIFAGASGYEFIRGDIRDMGVCLEACRGVEYVLHQAAIGSVPRSMKFPQLYCENNILGTANMLEAARQSGSVRRFVYASSSSVYGDSSELPQREGHEGTPLSPYAMTKRCNEEWARQYARLYGMTAVGLRYFNVFGRRQNPDGDYAAVIPRFLKLLLAGENPVINGDGEQSRDFTYVENVVEANLKACVAPAESVAGEVFNIAYGASTRLIDLFRMVTAALGCPDHAPVFGPPRPGDIARSLADISRAEKLLDYRPSYDFRSGLSEAIEWYRENLRPAAPEKLLPGEVK